MLWIGERTCQHDGAHIEFLFGVSNPLGVKVSDKMPPADPVKLCEILNPVSDPMHGSIIKATSGLKPEDLMLSW
ncbi:unnamed protein product [Sphagnum compactum]